MSASGLANGPLLIPMLQSHQKLTPHQILGLTASQLGHSQPLFSQQQTQALDLSSTTPITQSSPALNPGGSPAMGHCSVIKGPAIGPLPSVITVKKPILPTCNQPNLNSNWIAMKFGAAVGPNRMSYPREFKLMVIDYYYANGQNKYRTCKEFQITKSMLNGWLQKIEKIRESRPGSLKSGRSGRRPQFPDIEKQLFTLYQNHLLSGQKVGNRWIRETARDLARKQCSSEELGGMCQFSERWLSNFKKRYRINLNRDWSSSSSAAGSCASSTSSASSNPDPEEGEAGEKSRETPSSAHSEHMDEESSISDNSSDTHPEAMEGLEVQPTAPPQHPLLLTPTNPQKPALLPIHEFYRQYPWLVRRSAAALNYEPGRRGRKVQFPQVEKVLYQRLLRRQAAGHRVSNRWLQQEARGIAADLCPEVLAEATKSARCMFSEHWLHNFKKRYGVSLKQQLIANRSGPISPKSPSPEPPTSTFPSESAPENSTPEEAPQNPVGSFQQHIPTSGASNPMALAALFQMQQWLLQQSYLSSLAAANRGNSGAFSRVGSGGLPLTLASLQQSAVPVDQSTPAQVLPTPEQGTEPSKDVGRTLQAAGVNLAEWYTKPSVILGNKSSDTQGDAVPAEETKMEEPHSTEEGKNSLSEKPAETE